MRLRQASEAHGHREHALWIAHRGKTTVGRIGACIDQPTAASDRTGWLGFFDCIDDTDTAAALFDAGMNWLAERAVDRALGPASFTINDECGLLVEGFGRPPVIGTAGNPPYYETLWLKNGWSPFVDLVGYRTRPENAMSERQLAAAAIAKERLGISVREIALHELSDVIGFFFSPERNPWSETWAQSPLSSAQLKMLTKLLRRLSVPELSLIAESREGQPVGVALSIADINEVLARIPSGRLFPMGWFNFVRYARQIKVFRIVAMGVLRKYDAKGVGPLLYAELFERARRHDQFEYADISWIAEDNHKIRHAVEAMGAHTYKRWRIYERCSFTPNGQR